MSTLARWWEQLREPQVQQWKLQCARAWDAAGSGTGGASAAAWEALFCYESDEHQSQSPEEEVEIAVIMDLVKAFERVSLDIVWKIAKMYDFPLGIATIVLHIFHFPRRVIVQGSTSEGTRTAAAIVAGSKLSVLFLKLVITGPMDRLFELFPQLSL